MRKIASFCVNHDILEKGMYLSRIDGDITTYDIRMFKPNGGVYMQNAAAHTFEHLFATFARNSSFAQNIIYVGPMGCLTGFYFLVRGMTDQQALDLFRDILKQIAGYTGEIPGAARKECGNYQMHDLNGAKEMAMDMTKVLQNWKTENMIYKQ